MRKKIIAGNWKMNYSVNQAEDFVYSIKDSINTTDVDVVICPNFVSLDRVSEAIEGTNIMLGAQNVYFEGKGAYTGETSVDMLAAVGARYCIVGHSERREYFKETDEIVNKKAKKLLEKDIYPIVCVGESLEQREDNTYFDVVEKEVRGSLDGIDSEMIASKVVIAYEPIWAIGTGKTATAEQANEMCKYIRDVVAKMYDEDTASKVRIQYGGSVKPSNANEILNMSDIDGALVGGASLTNDFTAIVNY